ncbi:MAG: ABC transporter ATP-binding protein [Alphaproteobacteria bacterium]|nr:ABC transporter ATP-binding protein [Alphaproteobacteria bacterium]
MGSASPSVRIEFRGVTKRFGKRGRGAPNDEVITAVEDVTLSVWDGEVVSLIGPSGCGKSTLLNMGSGLYQPTEGRVVIDGTTVDRPNSHVAFMLQKDLLLPWRTIRQNVEIGLEIMKTPARDRRPRALGLLEKCRLDQFVDHYPHQLSGGMRQRAALARTLAVDPSVLLLDEPFSALDAQTKMVLQQDLARTVADAQKTTIFITHDLAESVALSDRILAMSRRPGKIIQEIVVDLPDRDNPMSRRQHRRVGEFVTELMSLLHIEEHACDEEI